MNKLFVVLLAGTFVLASASALADDKTPAQPVDQAKPKADTDAAKANAKAMTPEEKVAAEKAKRAAEREEALSRAQRPWTVEEAHRLDRELSTNRQAEKDAAKAAAAKMTPEEKAAKRKAARAKRQQELDGSKPLPSGTPPPGYNAIDWRYLEPLPPERWPVQRDPAKSNP